MLIRKQIVELIETHFAHKTFGKIGQQILKMVHS